jgi:hypothetical protein
MTLPKNSNASDGTNERPDTPARARTRARLQQLLLAATAMGAAASEPDHRIVCDPLPPPISCPEDGNMGQRLYSEASWAERAGKLIARVRVTYAYRGSRRGAKLVFEGNPKLTGAKLLRVARGPAAIEFDCRPNRSVAKVTVFVPMTCDATDACYRMELDVRRPQAETAVPITVIKTGC